MEAFWHSAGLEMGNRCGGGSRRWFWRRVSSPGEVPVGVFWLDINLLGWWEPVYAGGARIGPRQSALAAAVNASR